MSTSQTAGEILPFQELSRVTRTLADSYLAHARATLDAIIARPELIERVQLERNGERYARTLLFGDSQMSVWAILWPPGARTSIHDHHCSCCFGVVSGVLSELRFRPVGPGQVVVDAILHRERGFVAAMLPSGPNIHQMANEGTEDALSVHIYGFDHTMHASSIHHEYELVSQ
jgi:predicted metal-dependent enzyme (double-stranded beta helix superfamily)